MNNIIQPLLAGIAIAMLCITPCGCSTTQLQTAETGLAQIATDVEPLVADYASDGEINYAQALPVAFNSLATYDPSASVQLSQLQSLIATTVSSFTNGTARTTGQKIANALVADLQAVSTNGTVTGAQANAALTQAGLGASNGANP